MRKLEAGRGRGQQARGALAACLLVALAACALWAAGGAGAQSGRRRPSPPSPVPQPTPSPEGESESGPGPRREESRPDVVASFIVMGEEDASFGADSVTRSDVLESFTSRLRRSTSVSVTTADRGTRGEAVRRAKSETSAHVVLLSLEEDFGASRGSTRNDRRSLVVRTHVFAPQTGALKFSDTVYQRAVRPTVGVGGVQLPIPTRTVGRYPSQLELRQAAHDAADRILSRFNAARPPNTP